MSATVQIMKSMDGDRNRVALHTDDLRQEISVSSAAFRGRTERAQRLITANFISRYFHGVYAELRFNSR
jgi:hypothetical protein